MDTGVVCDAYDIDVSHSIKHRIYANYIYLRKNLAKRVDLSSVEEQSVWYGVWCGGKKSTETWKVTQELNTIWEL